MTEIHEDILKWQRDHQEKDDEQFAKIHKTMETLPCKEDIREIVRDEFSAIFRGKGILAKNTLITTAIVIGSITAIVLGLKTILMWFGIIVTKQ